MAFPGLPGKERERLAQDLVDRPEQARQAAGSLKGLLEAQSPRLSAIAPAWPGHPAATANASQRFLQGPEPQAVLLRRFEEEAPFGLGDPTEVPRQQARKTEDGGRLSEGKPLGFRLPVPARPAHGRALPVVFPVCQEVFRRPVCKRSRRL